MDFFTWATLGTYAGAVAATSLVTQLLKDIPVLKALPTRILSYIIAAMILVIGSVATGPISVGVILLALVNAVVVSLASNGAFDGINAALLPADYADYVSSLQTKQGENNE